MLTKYSSSTSITNFLAHFRSNTETCQAYHTLAKYCFIINDDIERHKNCQFSQFTAQNTVFKQVRRPFAAPAVRISTVKLFYC